MSENLVNVQHIAKKYCRDLKRSLVYGVHDVLTEIRGKAVAPRLRDKEFWAVQDVSFQLRRGDSLGIIGRNGAGKTTLLKMLHGLIKPTQGSITMRGRIQALIALNAGVSQVLTGRENIYINGAMMGLSYNEITRRLDAIVDFAEIGDFLDTPMRNYSSGMRVRLGFAVAVNVRPDVLIIDEVLAVGDQKFRRKARNAMTELLKQDIALIFISHNLHEVIGITQQTLWLEHGKPLEMGDSALVCAHYLRAESGVTVSTDAELPELEVSPKRTADLIVTEIQTQVDGQQGERLVTLTAYKARFDIQLTLRAESNLDEMIFHQWQLMEEDGSRVGQVVLLDQVRMRAGTQIDTTFTLDLSSLLPGRYQLAYMIPTHGGPELEHIENLLYVDIQAARLEDADMGKPVYARMGGTGRGAFLLPVTLKESLEQQTVSAYL
jgi:ABC-type polysaccharide/polyol phosphate transport system ATPase subunit